jgi:hypothetical protein
VPPLQAPLRRRRRPLTQHLAPLCSGRLLRRALFVTASLRCRVGIAVLYCRGGFTPPILGFLARGNSHSPPRNFPPPLGV